METTKAQKFIEIAQLVKAQNPLFMQHFKSMNSIIRVYKVLPADYDRKKSIKEYIRQNKGKQVAEKLMLVFNTEFGFRYFENAPYKWLLRFGLSHTTYRSGKEVIEVMCTPYDRCDSRNDYNGNSWGTSSITIKTLGDARRAVERLTESVTKNRGNDYEVYYGDKLKEAMKQDDPSNEDLQEGVYVRL